MKVQSQKQRVALTLEALEAREVRSVSSLWTSGNTLFVQTDNVSTSVDVVKSGSNIVIREIGTTKSWPYVNVAKVQFQGGTGHDTFINRVELLPVVAYGNGGNDYLEGFNANDYFVGGSGMDLIKGFGGKDKMWGDSENDVLIGGLGDDELIGGTGNDRLNGRGGYDKFWGGYGNDVLIAVDGYTSDEVQGGPDTDIIWGDRNSTYVDNTWEGEGVHYVSAFANGADRTLDGDKIADPKPNPGHIYKSFAGNPLFSAAGPKLTDAVQGDLYDCWLIAAVGAIANDSPMVIRSYVVNFDDGTYGVRLGNSFYRVDADLPVLSASSTTPRYAKLGASNSLWVALVEKAYAHHQNGSGTYASIEWGSSVDVNKAFGATATYFYNFSSYGSATQLANEIWTRWYNRESMTIGFTGVAAGAPVTKGHAYPIANVTRNSAGQVVSITLRNPWGYDGAGNDGNNDGFVTLSPAQIFASTGSVRWGRV